MTSKIFSATIQGLEVNLVEVQVDVARGLPAFNIVGLGDTSIKESKERIRSSIKNSGYKFPPNRKTINLAPARLRKQGTLLDLPIALGILSATNQLNFDSKDSLYIGELTLDGSLHPIKGALPIIAKAQKMGMKNIYLPSQNATEASFLKDIKIYPVNNLKQLVNHLEGHKPLRPLTPSKLNISPPSFIGSQIIGLTMAKRALSIAVAGQHNLLIYGSPGCGKTIICRSFKQLLPPMTEKEIMETNILYSMSGKLNDQVPIILRRPFREVHSNATKTSIIGGGGHPQPGEISLAHNGVLFLDEITQFPKQIIESLRDPLENHFISIKRNNYHSTFPANFTLLATMNPCPCGYHGDPKVRCICSQSQIHNYKAKLSGPILDRFDLFIRISNSSLKKLTNNNHAELQLLSEQIATARDIQNNRGTLNQLLTTKQLAQHCPISTSAQKLLSQAEQSLNLSNRAYVKIIRVSRTIADLEKSPAIKDHHLAEALQYRQMF